MKTVDELVSEIESEIDELTAKDEVSATSDLSDMILALVLKQLLRRLSKAQKAEYLAGVVTLEELVGAYELLHPDKDLGKVKNILAQLKYALS